MPLLQKPSCNCLDVNLRSHAQFFLCWEEAPGDKEDKKGGPH